MGRSILEGGGGLLGSLFGPAGAAAGKMAGSGLSTILGLGDYEIKENVFMHGTLPKIVNDSPSGGTIIRHTEYLGDVITAAVANTFTNTAYGLNPADEGTFPWLAQIAANYEEYEFEGLMFQFRSTSANALNSVNTALGTVMLATNYDSADPLFASKTEMLNYEFSCSTKPSESVLHMIECAPNQTVLGHRYTRPGLPPAGTDIRFFDLGKFQIATTGFQGTSVNIGELHATYQVRLLKPKLFVALGSDINYAHSTNGTGVTALTPLGTASARVVVGDNIGLTITSNSVTFPVSRVIENYWVYLSYIGTVPAVMTYPIVTATNANLTPTIGLNTPAAGETATAASMHFKMTTLGDGTFPVLTWGAAGTIPTGTVNTRLVISQSPNDFP